MKLDLEPSDWQFFEGDPKPELYDEIDLRKQMLLGDGGIYDNLGLERVAGKFDKVLVSDAGAPFSVFTDSRLVQHAPLPALALRALRAAFRVPQLTVSRAHWSHYDAYPQGIRPL